MLNAIKAHAPERGRIRIVYRMAIGIEYGKVEITRLVDALYALDDALTLITGGVVRIDGSGTWIASSEQDDFSGPIERDMTFTYLLSMTPHQESKSLTNIRQTTRVAIREFELPVTHIHMERSLVEACHFTIHR